MISTHRRLLGGPAGMAVGALLAAPLISLVTSAVANADDYTTFPITDVLTTDTTTGAYDSYLTTPDFDNDFFSTSSTTFEDVLTIPGVFQDSITDTDGVFSFGTPEFTSADFGALDPGLAAIGDGGVMSAAADVWSGLF